MTHSNDAPFVTNLNLFVVKISSKVIVECISRGYSNILDASRDFIALTCATSSGVVAQDASRRVSPWPAIQRRRDVEQ